MFFKREDPTANWPASGAEPTLDLAGASVGPVRLGDPIEAARAFGKPKRLAGSAKDGNATLEYPTFELEFSAGALVCVKFDVDPGSRVPFAGDIVLTPATSPVDAQVWFGAPQSDSRGPDGLRWIDFERDGNTLALQFDEDGLACVQLYAEGYA